MSRLGLLRPAIFTALLLCFVASSFADTLKITSVPPGAAEIYIDGEFHGNAPATLKLPAGPRAILLKSPGRSDCTRTLVLPKSSKLNLKAIFVPSPSS
ncbi:MAG TPA: PEGA domain-containing protein [Candidatus Limnocylindrales bacterium]|nr:PEGA domain-containing protein [Candidatus Limnocylindrales bacterium]